MSRRDMIPPKRVATPPCGGRVAWFWLLLGGRPPTATDSPPGDHPTADELRTATKALTDLGPRLVATPAEEQARSVVESQLRDAGADVSSEPFVWDAWQPGQAAVSVGNE